MITKQALVHRVCDTAMHILHDSYFNGSDLWPKNGFKIGLCPSEPPKNTIYVHARPWTMENIPLVGTLAITLYTVNKRTREKQAKHLLRLFDCTVKEDLFFEDEYPDSWMLEPVWFKFTYTPTSK
jgi:hypothetical protein